MRNDKDEQLSFAPTYYPNAVSPSGAAQIEVASGAEVAGLDFRLVKTRRAKVSGRVAPRGNHQVSFVDLAPMGLGRMPDFQRTRHVMTDGEGNFTFRGVEPGRYGVSIDNQPDEKRKSPYAEIEVAVADVEGLQLGFGTNPDIDGIVRTEGASECIQKPFVVDLESENNTLRHVRAQVKEDGAFKLMDVPLLKMRVSAFSSSLADCYVKSIRLGNREQEEMTADLGEGPGVLVITLSPKAAWVTGSVTDAKGRPAANGAVALIAKDSKGASQIASLSQSDPKGAFAIQGLRPGLYTIFAFDKADGGFLRDSELLKKYEEKGEAIELKESDRVTKDLKLMVAEDASDGS